MGEVIQHPATPPKERTLKSYKVFDHGGNLAFIVILSDKISLAAFNRLLQNGMSVTAVDHRSDLVNKEYVD